MRLNPEGNRLDSRSTPESKPKAATAGQARPVLVRPRKGVPHAKCCRVPALLEIKDLRDANRRSGRLTLASTLQTFSLSAHPGTYI